jgi:hypothetical protein
MTIAFLLEKLWPAKTFLWRFLSNIAHRFVVLSTNLQLKWTRLHMFILLRDLPEARLRTSFYGCTTLSLRNA